MMRSMEVLLRGRPAVWRATLAVARAAEFPAHQVSGKTLQSFVPPMIPITQSIIAQKIPHMSQDSFA